LAKQNIRKFAKGEIWGEVWDSKFIARSNFCPTGSATVVMSTPEEIAIASSSIKADVASGTLPGTLRRDHGIGLLTSSLMWEKNIQ